MSGRFPFKRTATYSLPVALYNDAALVDLTAYTITSRIQFSDGTTVDLTCTKAANQTTTGMGLYTITAPAPTAPLTWPLGPAKQDIMYVDGSGNDVPTETFEIVIIDGVTP